MAGTVNISRDIWDEATFKDSEMSQREAWFWLNAKASWKDRTVRFAGVEIETLRGQLVASSRYLAKAWMWSEPRVRRYFDMLENRRMIQRKTDAGITVITICNYDEIQNCASDADAAATHLTTQQRRTADAKKNKDVIRGKEGSHVSDTQNVPVLDLLGPETDAKKDPFCDFWKIYPKKVAKASSEKIFARMVKSGVSPQDITHGAERYAAECVGKDKTYIKQPDGWLNARRWEDYQNQPDRSETADFIALQAEKDRKARENYENAIREEQERQSRRERWMAQQGVKA